MREDNLKRSHQSQEGPNLGILINRGDVPTEVGRADSTNEDWNSTRLDEFQKRIQLEAVAVGFLATGVAIFIYGYLQKAQAVGPLNMGLVWIFMLAFYGVGYFAAVSHYR